MDTRGTRESQATQGIAVFRDIAGTQVIADRGSRVIADTQDTREAVCLVIVATRGTLEFRGTAGTLGTQVSLVIRGTQALVSQGTRGTQESQVTVGIRGFLDTQVFRDIAGTRGLGFLDIRVIAGTQGTPESQVIAGTRGTVDIRERSILGRGLGPLRVLI